MSDPVTICALRPNPSRPYQLTKVDMVTRMKKRFRLSRMLSLGNADHAQEAAAKRANGNAGQQREMGRNPDLPISKSGAITSAAK
jgi:hypothetical protein